MSPCRIVSCPGLTPYPDALAWQQALAGRRGRGEVCDTLLLLEHPPTVTLGRGTDEADLLTSGADLAARGIAVERVDRGGEVSYHGPGQLVGYPILDLRRHGQDLHRYLRDLEEVLILTLGAFGLDGARVPGRTGVWVEDAKIAAIGIKVSRWVSTHGWALNVTTDLTPFRRDFVPCGIRDRGVTSLAELLGAGGPTRAKVEAVTVEAFAGVFSVQPVTGREVGILLP
jgi:lipoyl(octanoyl) transferase